MKEIQLQFDNTDEVQCERALNALVTFMNAQFGSEIFIGKKESGIKDSSPAVDIHPLMQPPKAENFSADFEEVKNPAHYNQFSVEVIEMMIRIYGADATAYFCELNAFKYRMRAGTKPGSLASKDLDKANWYMAKKDEMLILAEERAIHAKG